MRGREAPRQTLSDRVASPAEAPRGLDLLLGSMRSKFLIECWPERPLVYHGPIDRLHRLTSLAALQSVPKLLSARAASYQDVTVFGGNGFAKHMPPREAIHFYQRGDNLSCAGLEATVPALRELLAELAIDLHEPAEYLSCGVFAASGGRGVTMHYDSVLTLNLQLHGEKVWRLAPNRHVENPFASCDNKDEHAPRFAKLPFPRTMPVDAMTFRVKPGSVVFIPRGYWHETDTFGESLALTFMIDVPTWRGRILHELRRRLEPLAAWRGGAMATQGGGGARGARGPARGAVASAPGDRRFAARRVGDRLAALGSMLSLAGGRASGRGHDEAGPRAPPASHDRRGRRPGSHARSGHGPGGRVAVCAAGAVVRGAGARRVSIATRELRGCPARRADRARLCGTGLMVTP
jgi:hypothetical protein